MKLYSLFYIILFTVLSLHHVRAQNDCPEAVMVCGTAEFYDLEAEGPGSISEISPGNACLSGENNTVWIKILIKDGGTLGFDLTPANSALETDFDFWLFGPDVTCTNLGTALRCSTTNPLNAGLNYVTTGMNEQSTDISEGPGADGDAYVNWITVEDGEIYYLIVDRPHGNGNFSIDWTGTATFHDIPDFLNPDNIPLDMLSDCDQNNMYDSGFAFDLTVYESMFIGPQTYVNITYHTSLNDVTTGEDPIENPTAYHNVQNPQVIYLRMTNTVTGCYDTEYFTLLREILPAGEPEDLFECDDDSDGYTTFNLALNSSNVINGQPNCTVTYYNNLENAMAGTGAIGPVYQNTVQYSEVIYARMMENGCLGYDLKSFTINTSQPEFENPDSINVNLSQCDDDGVNDQSSIFDLTTHQDMFTGAQDNLVFSYHLTQQQANNNTLPIEAPTTFVNTSSPQTVYVRVFDTDTGCYNVLPFQLIISNDITAGSQPVLKCDYDANGQETVTLSDYNNIVRNGNIYGIVTYHTSEEDALNSENPITTVTATYTEQVIWARLQNNQGCFAYDVVSFTVRAVAVPVANNPDNVDMDMSSCDDDTVNDNATAFDLTPYEAMLVGSQTDITITYHTTAEDAPTGQNAIENPQAFMSVVPLQTIYVRLTNQNGCEDIITFTVEIEERLQPGNPQNLVLCDDYQNGINTFDLSQNTPLILGNSINGAVSYHLTQQQALNGTNPLPTTYQNQFTYQQTMWARLYSTDGCQGFYVKQFLLKVQPLPQFQNPQGINLNLQKCDDDAVDDQSTPFNLTTNEAAFSGSQQNLTYTYYTSAQNAQQGIDFITNPQAFANTGNPQTIYVRAYNTVTGCHNIMPFDIEIINPVVAVAPQPMVGCDADGDGFELLDLTQNNTVVQNGNTTAVVTYYTSETDALNEENAITTYNATYTPQTLWVRLENTQGCFGHDVVSFTVQAMPLPVFNNPGNTDLTIRECDEDGVSNNSTTFNLTVHQTLFTGSQSGMVYTYYTTLTDAQDDTNAIQNPQAYTNTLPVETIYVRMTNSGGCFSIFNFNIEILNPLFPGIPQDLTVCDDSKNGRNLFNLTDNDALIINTTPNGVVSYHLTLADAHNGNNPLTSPYLNQWPYLEQIIYARLQSSAGCTTYTIVAFKLHVQRLPQFVNPQNTDINLAQCDNYGADDQSTLFDLTTHQAMFTGNQQGLDIKYYTDATEAAQNSNAIATPAAFANTSNPQTVYVRFFDATTGCQNILPFTIEVVNPIHAGIPENLAQCDFMGNGLQLFNLAANYAAIINGQQNVQVTYYATQQDAQNATNPIGTAAINAPAYTASTIWARVESTNGCYGFAITSFTIEVLPMPDTSHSIDIHDFTVSDNAITVNMNANPFDFEYSLDGETYQDSNVFPNLEAGVYTVYIRSKNNCKLVTDEVALLNYPRFFTPNGDGANDVWNVFYLEYYPNAKVNIFDRYGKLVNSYWGKDKGWDGTYNGHNLFATDYWFTLDFEGRHIKGHFSLVR